MTMCHSIGRHHDHVHPWFVIRLGDIMTMSTHGLSNPSTSVAISVGGVAYQAAHRSGRVLCNSCGQFLRLARSFGKQTKAKPKVKLEPETLIGKIEAHESSQTSFSKKAKPRRDLEAMVEKLLKDNFKGWT